MKKLTDYTFSTRKLPDGRVRLILSYKSGGLWKQKTKIFEKAKDARSSAAKNALLKKAESETSLDASATHLSLYEFAAEYLKIRSDMSFATKRSYLCRIQSLSKLKNIHINEITYADIMNQYEELHYAERTMQAITTSLNVVFSAAVRYRVISYSPMMEFEYHEKEQKKSRRVRTFTDEEIQLLLREFSRFPQHHVILAICMYTGCRIGEALGLTWADIDLFQRTLSISKQYGEISHKKYGFKPVKNKNGVRTVPIPLPLIQILSAYQDHSLRYLDGRLTSIRFHSMITHKIKRFLPGHSVHDCRHTYATKLLTSGVDIRTIAALLGDGVPTVEMVYLNYTDQMREKAADTVNRIFL